MSAARRARVQPLIHAAVIDAVFKQGKRLTSEHFALHWRVLSVGDVPTASSQTDVAPAELPTPPILLTTPTLTAVGVAFVVSKRLAKRAVRRNLIRRAWRTVLAASPQLQAALASDTSHPGAGAQPKSALHLVVRLAKPFAAAKFLSAASGVLKQQVNREALDLLERLQAKLGFQMAVAAADLATQEQKSGQTSGHTKAS